MIVTSDIDEDDFVDVSANLMLMRYLMDIARVY